MLEFERLKPVVTWNTTQRKREKNKKGSIIEREKESDEEIH